MNAQIADILKTYLALSSADRCRFDQVLALASEQPIISETADPILAKPLPLKPRRGGSMRTASMIIPAASSQNGIAQAGSEIPMTAPGAGLDVASPDRFADLRFRQAWRPETHAAVYVASCEGTARLGSVLKQPVFKAGSHGGGDVADRILGLGKVRYGSAMERDGALVVEPGFDQWYLEPLLQPKLPISALSPVRFRGNHLAVELPVGMSAALFDQKLAKALANNSLHVFLWSAAGQAHCRDLGIDPATMIRSTPTTARKRSKTLCTELVVLRPRFDTPYLIEVIEKIIFEFVVGSILPHER